MSDWEQNRTMPWNDEEMITVGKYKLAYEVHGGALRPLLPGKDGKGKMVDYKELYKLNQDIKLPKIVRHSAFGGRSKY
jgi:hypothetical protein